MSSILRRLVSCAVIGGSISLACATQSFAADERYYQERYCAGMELEHRLASGGRVDCLNDAYAIEVDQAEHWYQAVGQSLYYAVETGRKPGIILLCPGSDVHAEGLCRSYIYRLDAALSQVSVPVRVWECFPEDAALTDCFEPEIGGVGESGK